MLLDELQEDTLKELFNLGVGRAADALSQMVGREIWLTVPQVLYLPWEEAVALLRVAPFDPVTAIRQGFSGPFGGEALLVYPEEQSLALVRALLQEDVPLEFLSHMEPESLLEVGNVILNACLGSLANVMGIELVCHLPEYCHCPLATLLPRGEDASCLPQLLVLYVDFSVMGHTPINGYVVLLLNLLAQESLRRELDKILGGLG